MVLSELNLCILHEDKGVQMKFNFWNLLVLFNLLSMKRYDYTYQKFLSIIILLKLYHINKV